MAASRGGLLSFFPSVFLSFSSPAKNKNKNKNKKKAAVFSPFFRYNRLFLLRKSYRDRGAPEDAATVGFADESRGGRESAASLSPSSPSTTAAEDEEELAATAARAAASEKEEDCCCCCCPPISGLKRPERSGDEQEAGSFPAEGIFQRREGRAGRGLSSRSWSSSSVSQKTAAGAALPAAATTTVESDGDGGEGDERRRAEGEASSRRSSPASRSLEGGRGRGRGGGGGAAPRRPGPAPPRAASEAIFYWRVSPREKKRENEENEGFADSKLFRARLFFPPLLFLFEKNKQKVASSFLSRSVPCVSLSSPSFHFPPARIRQR
jgi:hypothetical protein